jgi:hypothetical protein
MIIMGIMIMNAPDIPDLSDVANDNGNCPDDDCAEIYAKIQARVDELKKRLRDLAEDRSGLPVYGQTMTVESHLWEFWAKQKNLSVCPRMRVE